MKIKTANNKKTAAYLTHALKKEILDKYFSLNLTQTCKQFNSFINFLYF